MISDELKAARAVIAGPFAWTQNQLTRSMGDVIAYCAQGALYKSNASEQAIEALVAVLARRLEANSLPTPTCGPGHSAPQPWKTWWGIEHAPYCGWGALAQFNNSTSQEAVLDLFDEAIRDAEAAEQPGLPLVDMTPKPLPASITALVAVPPTAVKQALRLVALELA